MAGKRSFLKQFWKEKKMVGAMAPSSKFLASKMLENVDFANSKVILELGPGTGVFTEKIIERLGEDAILLVFELNDVFYNALAKKINDPRVKLIHDSAENILKYLEELNLDKCDAVISSLPLAVFPHKLRVDILHASQKALRPGGAYIQFQYSLQAKKYLTSIFSEVSINFTPLNFPPAFIYTCKN